MKKKLWLWLIPAYVVGAGFLAFVWYRYAPAPLDPAAQLSPDAALPDPLANASTEESEESAVPTSGNLRMAYINEAPENNWTGSWKNGCEEAAIAMVEKYYLGVETVTIPEAKAFMQMLFDAQQQEYGSDANSDSVQTLWMIDTYTSFSGTIVDNPTAEMIKREIDAGRPVIALHHGFALGNNNIPFLPTGSSYHATVVKGYDDARSVFIVHDTGDTKQGENRLYDYDVFMNSLRDYQHATGKADGPARVILTRSGKE